MHDWQLLKEYQETGSQAAFANLVERYIHLVYSTCLREVRDPHLAEDVTQVVFVILAQKANRLAPGTVLSGWLFQTARFAARNAVQQEMRRQRREEKVAEEMKRELEQPGATPDWAEVEPLLHQALGTLKPADRNAVILRFFEKKSFHETAQALMISEDAARMRVTRAVDKLRRFFTRRGYVIPGAVLAYLLSEHAVQAAPASCLAATLQVPVGLAASSLMAAHTGMVAPTGAKVLLLSQHVQRALLLGQLKTATAVLIGTAIIGTGAYQVAVGASHAPEVMPHEVVPPGGVSPAEVAAATPGVPNQSVHTNARGGHAQTKKVQPIASPVMASSAGATAAAVARPRPNLHPLQFTRSATLLSALALPPLSLERPLSIQSAEAKEDKAAAVHSAAMGVKGANTTESAVRLLAHSSHIAKPRDSSQLQVAAMHLAVPAPRMSQAVLLRESPDQQRLLTDDAAPKIRLKAARPLVAHARWRGTHQRQDKTCQYNPHEREEKENLMKHSQHTKWLVGTVAVALAAGAPRIAQAQPGANGGNGGNGGGNGGGRPNWQNMTPEQRQQMMQGFMENRVRQQLTGAGFADKAVQDPIVTYWKAQDTARQNIRDKQQQLAQALNNPATSNDEVGIMLRDLRDAITEEKTRQTGALKDLDTAVSYSKNVKLEALLTVLGLIGDESSYTARAGMGMGGPGGRGGGPGGGGPGGGFGGGGGRGGRGGRGGGNGGGGNGGGGGGNGGGGAGNGA